MAAAIDEAASGTTRPARAARPRTTLDTVADTLPRAPGRPTPGLKTLGEAVAELMAFRADEDVDAAR